MLVGNSNTGSTLRKRPRLGSYTRPFMWIRLTLAAPGILPPAALVLPCTSSCAYSNVLQLLPLEK